jgi:hypothetical protein
MNGGIYNRLSYTDRNRYCHRGVNAIVSAYREFDTEAVEELTDKVMTTSNAMSIFHEVIDVFCEYGAVHLLSEIIDRLMKDKIIDIHYITAIKGNCDRYNYTVARDWLMKYERTYYSNIKTPIITRIKSMFKVMRKKLNRKK